MLYRLVQLIDGDFVVTDAADVAAIEARGFAMTGLERRANTNLRPELRGQPMFAGLCGPMYGGPGVVRYEDWQAYNRLST